MVVYSEDFLRHPGVEQGTGFIHDQIDHGTGFRVVEVFLDHFGAATGVYEMVETDARHFEFAQQLEDFGDFNHVTLVDGKAQADLEASALQFSRPSSAFLKEFGTPWNLSWISSAPSSEMPT